MNTTTDPIVVKLTGILPFILITAGILTFVVSLFLLRLYRRRVLRSMKGRIDQILLPPASPQPLPTQQTPSSSLYLAAVDLSSAVPSTSSGEALFRWARWSPWRAAAIYALAGTAYAAIMTTGHLLAAHFEFFPIRFIFLFWMYLWPAVLAMGLVACSSLRQKFVTAIGYFVLLGVQGSFVLQKNPDLTLPQLLAGWLAMNGPATVLLLAFLNRRVRAVGPMILVFMIVAVAGSASAMDIAANNERILRFLSEIGSALHLSAWGVVIVLVGFGFLAFGVGGWGILKWIGRRYQKKKSGDQSITLDSVFLLFGIVQSLFLVFLGPEWIFTGLTAFCLYKGVVRIGFRYYRLPSAIAADGPKLLLLRVFSLGKRSERLFDALEKHWLRTGSFRLIAGPDLATSTVKPHEFLEFLGGRLARRFIDRIETLDQRLSEMDTCPDWDGRFRVTDFFCHEDTWKMTLSRLVGISDVILMDLRGFSSQNAGCAFEIEELINLAPLHRVLLVVDPTTDSAFLERTAREAWSRLRLNSPNRQSSSGQLRLFRFTGAPSREVLQLLRWMCIAASSKGPAL